MDELHPRRARLTASSTAVAGSTSETPRSETMSCLVTSASPDLRIVSKDGSTAADGRDF